MLFLSTKEISNVQGGVEIFSPTGLIILTIGIIFTVGLPLTMILIGRKD